MAVDIEMYTELKNVSYFFLCVWGGGGGKNVKSKATRNCLTANILLNLSKTEKNKAHR